MVIVVWDGATVMRVTGSALITMLANPGTSSMVARISTGPPTFFAVTTPLSETSAMLSLLEDQATERLVSTMPLPVRGVAASWRDPPTTTLAAGGSTSTVATFRMSPTLVGSEQERAGRTRRKPARAARRIECSCSRNRRSTR